MERDEAYNSEIIPEEEIDWRLQGFPKLMYEWCKEVGLHTPIGYERDYDERAYVLYTDHPGALIGKAGCLVDKYTKRLQQRETGWTFRFKEIRGGFVNFIVPGKKKKK